MFRAAYIFASCFALALLISLRFALSDFHSHGLITSSVSTPPAKDKAHSTYLATTSAAFSIPIPDVPAYSPTVKHNVVLGATTRSASTISVATIPTRSVEADTTTPTIVTTSTESDEPTTPAHAHITATESEDILLPEATSTPTTHLLPTKDPQSLLQTPFPHKVWQSWKDDSENPTERTPGFPHEWRSKHPDWRYERFTDDNCVAYVNENFPEPIAKLFTDLEDPIMRADFLRYLVMFREGGVWGDIDTVPKRPATDWIPEEYANKTNLVIGIENDHHGRPIFEGVPYSVQFVQYAMFAKPEHPFFAKLIQRVAENLREIIEQEKAWTAAHAQAQNFTTSVVASDNKSGLHRRFAEGRIKFEDVMKATGPFVFTQTLFEHFEAVTGESYDWRTLNSLRQPKLVDDVLILPKDAFGWLQHEHAGHDPGDGVNVLHIFQGSWRDSHPD